MKISKTSNSLRLLAILIFLTILTGCSGVEKRQVTRGEIIAVWKHEVGKYSVSSKEGKILRDLDFKNLDFVSYWPNFELIMDVPEESNMWYEATWVPSWRNGYNSYVKIHIRSINDIGGAGWEHRSGKTIQKGYTERVQ